ncbi:pilus assembly protein PilM [Priestia filamentosa]|uniref:pilus assembly protein PilM n=1 Tax=Priestia filamentosa TaxID=1402861 RepID=UPI00397D20CA
MRYQLSSEEFLSIDIGSHNMKVLEVKRKGQNYAIKKAFTISEMENYFTGADIFNVNGIVETLSQITQLERSKTKNVILSFSGAKLQTKIINVPELPTKELRTFVELEYPKHFQNFNKITDVVDFMPVGTFVKPNTNQKQLGVLLASYPTSDAERLVKEFQKKKYKVNVIDVDVAALGNVGKVYSNEENENTIILHVGHNISEMVFLKGNAIVFNRTVGSGITGLIRAIQNQEDITALQAESLLREVGLQAAQDITLDNLTIFADDYNDIVEQYLTNILNDAYRSLQSVSANYDLNVSTILLTGGFSSITHAKEISQRILEIPVEEFRMGKEEKFRLENGITIINDTGKKIDGSYAICVGMAIRNSM